MCRSILWCLHFVAKISGLLHVLYFYMLISGVLSLYIKVYFKQNVSCGLIKYIIKHINFLIVVYWILKIYIICLWYNLWSYRQFL